VPYSRPLLPVSDFDKNLPISVNGETDTTVPPGTESSMDIQEMLRQFHDDSKKHHEQVQQKLDESQEQCEISYNDLKKDKTLMSSSLLKSIEVRWNKSCILTEKFLKSAIK